MYAFIFERLYDEE
uniref:Uncharacterized protein n=1 Tax=Romanomermis culicivorax TaxID=13658 RepID=A0A915KLK1_ROMCU